MRILPGVLCHLPPQAVEKLSCPQSAQLAACSELLSSKASPSFTPSPIPFSASCLLEPTSFPVCPGGWPSPTRKERKSSRPVSPKAIGSRADLISKGSLWVSTSGLGVPSSRLLLEGVRGILFLFGISLAARKEENGGGTRPAKGCPVLASTAVHLWARLGILALTKGQAARKVRHVGLTWLQGDPGLTVSGAFNGATNPFSGRAVVGNMAWLQCRHSRG